MPTKKPRVQVMFDNDTFFKLKELAKIENRSLSKMAFIIIKENIRENKN